MNRAELKSAAKSQIKGNIGILFIITLIIAGISFGVSFVLYFIPGGSLVSSIIITPAFTLSISRVYLNLANGITPEANDAFSGFDDFWSSFKVSFLAGLFTFLWSLLFIIPGIIHGLSYSMAPYILAENKEKSAMDCIEESIEMTDGHKWDLFVLNLSFIGWILLEIITLGLASIWVTPYMSATGVNAYLSLKPRPTSFETTAEEVTYTPVDNDVKVIVRSTPSNGSYTTAYNTSATTDNTPNDISDNVTADNNADDNSNNDDSAV